MQVLLIKAGRDILLSLAPVPLSCNEFCRKTFCFRSLNGKKWFWLPKCGNLLLDFYVRRLNNGKKKNMRKMAPSSSSNIIQVSWSPDIPYWFENVLLTLLFSFKSCFASKHFCRLVVMNLQRITTWLGSFLSALRSLSAFLSILFWFLVSTHINLVSSIMNLLYATCLAPNSWWTKLATS